MNKRLVLFSWLIPIALVCATAGPAHAASSSCPPGKEVQAGSAPYAAVVSVAEELGARLAQVSLLARPAQVRRQIRRQYRPLVMPSLLASWLADPSTAPGRTVSSPWPTRVGVRAVCQAGAGAYEIHADVVYVTSVEVARKRGAARRQAVVVKIVRSPDHRWRIARYADAPSQVPPTPHTPPPAQP